MIAIDIDGTIADTAKSARAFLREALGLKLEPVTRMNELMSGVPSGRAAEGLMVLKAAFNDPAGHIYGEARPFPGAAATLGWLSERGLAGAYITHRPNGTKAATEAWLQEHGFPSLPLLHERDKVAAMRTMKCSILIDDDADIGRAAAGRHYAVVLPPAWHATSPVNYPHVVMSDWRGLAALLVQFFGAAEASLLEDAA